MPMRGRPSELQNELIHYRMNAFSYSPFSHSKGPRASSLEKQKSATLFRRAAGLFDWHLDAANGAQLAYL